MTGASLTSGVDNMGKSARRKQWLAGWQVSSSFLTALFNGLGLDKTYVCAIQDVFPYDVGMAEGIMRTAGQSWAPKAIYIAAVWSDTNTRDAQRTQESKNLQNVALSKWLSFGRFGWF